MPGSISGLAVASRATVDVHAYVDLAVAAQSSRLSLSGNVLNLPLRDPAILAKSAASLDLLGGDRFELGLGAGAFWDAIVAIGGRRLTPAESVDALAEAIQIIRAIWDVDNRETLRIQGTTTTSSEPSEAPSPPTTSESGSALSSRGCCP